MQRFLSSAATRLGALGLGFALTVHPAAAAEHFVALSHLAPELGYHYVWVASESAVALTRPGLYVLVRSGNPLYDVNDAVETTAEAPRFHDNDVYVGPAFAARLRSLAIRSVASRELPQPPGAPSTLAAGPLRGILTLNAVPTNISDALVVSGNGPANAPLTITLWADIARDLPRVLVSRTSAQTDATGTFSLEISTAPLHLQKSRILITATSVAGVTEAHTSLVLGQPSPNIAHPIDELPRDFRPH